MSASYTLEELSKHHQATGSIVSRYVPESDYKQLQSERDALAATVEALQSGIREIMINIGAGATMSEVCEMVYIMESSFSATPQHLRDVRAEAGRAGFIAGLRLRSKGVCLDFEAAADSYAERVKDGEK